MIKVQLEDIINSIEVFNEILTQNCKGSVAFKVARLARELSKEIETFNSEKQKIVLKYCEKDENDQPITQEGGNIKIAQDKIQECNEEFITLLETEVEINAAKLTIDCIDNFTISPQKMGLLEPFIEEE